MANELIDMQEFKTLRSGITEKLLISLLPTCEKVHSLRSIPLKNKKY